MQNVDFQSVNEAVEVTTTFDSTVVDVVHLQPERARRRWLPFACGAALLLVAALAFGSAVSTAAGNKVAQDAWIASGAAPTDFRPAHVPLAYDVLAGVGLAGAIFALAFGLWGMGRRSRSSFVAGTGEDADLALATQPGSLAIVEATAQGPVVARNSALAISVIDGGRELGVDDAIAQGVVSTLADGRIVLRRGVNAVLSRGMTKVFVRPTDAPRSGAAAAMFAIEGRSAQFFAGSALAHAAVLALLWSVPPDASSLSLDSGLATARLARVDTAAFEDKVDEPDPSDGSGNSGDADAAEALMSPPDGQTGEPDKTNSKGRFTIARRADTPQLSRSQAIERAKTGGILGVLSSGDPFANIAHGTADFSSGFDEADVRGGIDGDVGAVRGTWGQWGVVGGVGTGPGWGTNKVGKLRWGQGNDGFGSCEPGQKCTGQGPGLRSRTKRKPDVTINKASTITGADPAIIRRYIRRKLPRVRHCYERELLNAPELSGTVTAQFVISPEGVVLSSRAAGSSSSALNSCVKSAMASISFPRFGHVVNVTYPFTFHRAGS